MPAKPLRIAWVGPGPGEDGGASGLLTDLLGGLARRGHRIDCFLPGRERPLPPRIEGTDNLTFVWGTSSWQWDRWYSRTKISAFASGMASRVLASLQLRRVIARRHRDEPYDLIYQYSTIENLAVPSRLARTLPVVIHPGTHVAGELRSLLAERRLSWQSQSRYMFSVVAAIMLVRALVQKMMIRRANLLICISSVFRDHITRDYGFPAEDTIVVANPVRLERFTAAPKALGQPPVILVLGRIAVRKGIEDVVAVAEELLSRDVEVRIRIVGGPSLASDYTKLLEHLPSENAEYAGPVDASEVPGELARSDVLLAPSKYEPFALTVAEALAEGVPVVATSEVGAIENVDRSVAAEVPPGDVPAMATAIAAMLDRVRREPEELRSKARAEAERLFAPDMICEQISRALERLVGRPVEDAAVLQSR
ncbi:MAG: transferase [Solirubrobacterales bacterium]|nr:transferase [Solirubrobacterales bacterium]